MADNVKIWEPTTGPLVASDDVGGVQFQKVKLDVGGDGASVPVVGTLPVSGTVTATGPLTDTQLRATPPAIYSLPVELQAAMTGLVGGKSAKVLSILGRRLTFASASVFQDVAQFLVGGQNLFTEPAVDTTYYAVSTSANDKAGSAGISKVRLVSLDAAGNEQVTSVTLNGTTQVSIGSGYTYFQWMESSELGTGVVAAGDITISSVNGVATEATTMAMIKAGGNRSLDGKYKTPTGYTCYLLDWYSMALNQDMDTRLRATVFADDRSVSPGIFHFQDTMYLSASVTGGGNAAHQPLNYLKLPAGAECKISTIPKATTGSPRIDANFTLLCVAN